MTFPEFAWDGNFLLWLQENLRNPVLNPALKAVTHLGDHGLFWILLTLVLLCFPKTRKAGCLSALAMLGSFLINNLCLKLLFARVRPYEVVQGLELIVGRAPDFSFPSGHSGVSFASAWAMHREIPRPWNLLLILLAALIAFSRLYVGIHYPTDVIAGTLTGLLSGAIAIWLYDLLERRFRTRP